MNIQKLYIDINKHLLEDSKPSIYLKEIYKDPLFNQYPFNILLELEKTKQSPLHHPEGNVWNHVLLVVNQAAKVRDKSKDRRVFMWAALLHDIGKPSTTRNKKGKITSYDHDKVGENLVVEFLKQFTDDYEFIDKVAKLVRYHMQILFVVKNLPFAEIEKMVAETDYNEVALLGFCDRMGRTNSNKKTEIENIKKFKNICKNFK